MATAKKTPKPVPAEGVKRYQVLRNLHHDGTAYEPNGSDVLTIDLAPEEAEPLLKIDVLREIAAEA